MIEGEIEIENIPPKITANVGNNEYRLEIKSDGTVGSVTRVSGGNGGGGGGGGCNTGTGVFGILSLITGLFAVQSYKKRP